MSRRGVRVGIDVGGTFIDLVLERADGTLHSEKVLSEPHDLIGAICAGLERALAGAGANAGEVEELIHATTLGSNAVLERRGPVTGAPDDARLPRHPADPALAPLPHVRRPDREGDADRAPLAHMGADRALPGRRLGPAPARGRGGAPGRRRAARGRRRDGRGLVPARLRRAGPRAPRRPSSCARSCPTCR